MPYLTLLGTVSAGWLLARLALAAQTRIAADGENAAVLKAKLVTARFFAEQFLPLAQGYLQAALGGATVLDFDPEQF